MYRIGIDLGGTNIAAGIVNEKFEIVCKASIPTGAERSAAEITADMAAICHTVCEKAGIDPSVRRVVQPALDRAEETGGPAAAMELPDGRIVTGKTSKLLGAAAALLLNALKALAGLPDALHLIAPEVIDPIQHLKVDHLGNRNPRLHTDEILIALSISAATNPTAALAMEQLPKLRDCQCHSSVILSQVDNSVFKKLGVHLTCEPTYQTKKLYHK